MLLLAGAGRAGVVWDSIAVVLKVYAVIPLLGERKLRRVCLALVLTMATVVVAPSLWIHYAQEFGAISARLARESDNGWSAFYHPKLLVPTAIAILLLWRPRPEGRRMARRASALALDRVPLLDIRPAGHDPTSGGLAGVPATARSLHDHALRRLAVRFGSCPRAPRGMGGRRDSASPP